MIYLLFAAALLTAGWVLLTLAELGLRREQPVSVPVLGVVGLAAAAASSSHVRVRVTGGDCPTGEVITVPRELVMPAHLAPTTPDTPSTDHRPTGGDSAHPDSATTPAATRRDTAA